MNERELRTARDGTVRVRGAILEAERLIQTNGHLGQESTVRLSEGGRLFHRMHCAHGRLYNVAVGKLSVPKALRVLQSFRILGPGPEDDR